MQELWHAFDPDDRERFEWLDKGGCVRQVHFHPQQIPIAGSTHWDYDRLLLDFVPGPNGRSGQVIARYDVELAFLCGSFREVPFTTCEKAPEPFQVRRVTLQPLN